MGRGRGLSEARKQSIYLQDDVIDALVSEGQRLDRSVSWLVQYCVRRSLKTVQALPTVPGGERTEAAE